MLRQLGGKFAYQILEQIKQELTAKTVFAANGLSSSSVMYDPGKKGAAHCLRPFHENHSIHF